MPCNLATTQANACSSGIGKETNPIALFQVIAQSLATSAASAAPSYSYTVESILSRACDSGIGKLTDENALWRIIAQNLCSVEQSETPVATCTTVTLSGGSQPPGTTVVNGVYVQQSATRYDMLPLHSSSNAIVFNFSGTGVWEIVSASIGSMYTLSGTFPTNWVAVGPGTNPPPTGVCS